MLVGHGYCRVTERLFKYSYDDGNVLQHVNEDGFNDDEQEFIVHGFSDGPLTRGEHFDHTRITKIERSMTIEVMDSSETKKFVLTDAVPNIPGMTLKVPSNVVFVSYANDASYKVDDALFADKSASFKQSHVAARSTSRSSSRNSVRLTSPEFDLEYFNSTVVLNGASHLDPEEPPVCKFMYSKKIEDVSINAVPGEKWLQLNTEEGRNTLVASIGKKKFSPPDLYRRNSCVDSNVFFNLLVPPLVPHIQKMVVSILNNTEIGSVRYNTALIYGCVLVETWRPREETRDKLRACFLYLVNELKRTGVTIQTDQPSEKLPADIAIKNLIQLNTHSISTFFDAGTVIQTRSADPVPHGYVPLTTSALRCTECEECALVTSVRETFLRLKFKKVDQKTVWNVLYPNPDKFPFRLNGKPAHIEAVRLMIITPQSQWDASPHHFSIVHNDEVIRLITHSFSDGTLHAGAQFKNDNMLRLIRVMNISVYNADGTKRTVYITDESLLQDAIVEIPVNSKPRMVRFEGVSSNKRDTARGASVAQRIASNADTARSPKRTAINAETARSASVAQPTANTSDTARSPKRTTEAARSASVAQPTANTSDTARSPKRTTEAARSASVAQPTANTSDTARSPKRIAETARSASVAQPTANTSDTVRSPKRIAETARSASVAQPTANTSDTARSPKRTTVETARSASVAQRAATKTDTIMQNPIPDNTVLPSRYVTGTSSRMPKSMNVRKERAKQLKVREEADKQRQREIAAKQLKDREEAEKERRREIAAKQLKDREEAEKERRREIAAKQLEWKRVKQENTLRIKLMQEEKKKIEMENRKKFKNEKLRKNAAKEIYLQQRRQGWNNRN
jgi:hypothetical protein